MAEATLDANPAEAAALEEAAREFDRARMKQIGGYHFAMVMGALTLWGAAATWAEVTGWALAEFAAVANALVAGFVIPSVLHEWGHFAGARLSGAASPVFDEPRRHFAMFDFQMDKNDDRQFAWMSWGGILAPWGVVLLAALFVPLSATGAAVLLATFVFKAVAASVFEVPVVLRAARSGNPGAELRQQATSGGIPRSRRIGALAGVACFALLRVAV